LIHCNKKNRLHLELTYSLFALAVRLSLALKNRVAAKAFFLNIFKSRRKRP